eukprot:TRINITY_DN9537_c0_g1_i1.p1 TRINITY_DN9537_c0_g1~~TRINITY_DN9537_c0_g1_i1.p1  ORF type:complete len:97 (-),score=16.04 TRINITY_DN9537_c0_g1_i1:79-369(-)
MLLREEVLCDIIAEVYVKKRKLGVRRLREIAKIMKDCLELKVDVDYRWVRNKLKQLYNKAELKRYFKPDIFPHKDNTILNLQKSRTMNNLNLTAAV